MIVVPIWIAIKLIGLIDNLLIRCACSIFKLLFLCISNDNEHCSGTLYNAVSPVGSFIWIKKCETKYEDTIGKILGNDQKFMKINGLFFTKYKERIQFVGGANFPARNVFEEVMDGYHKVELILAEEYTCNAQKTEKRCRNNEYQQGDYNGSLAGVFGVH